MQAFNKDTPNSEAFGTNPVINTGRGTIPSLSKQLPATAMRAAGDANMGNSYKAKDFTVQMNNDLPTAGNDNQPSAIGRNGLFSAPKVQEQQVNTAINTSVDVGYGINNSFMDTSADAGASQTGTFTKQSLGFGAMQMNKNQRNVAMTLNATNDDMEPEIVNDDGEKKVEGKAKFNGAYSYFVLFIVLACRIMVQWHRKGLNYAYGYKGLGDAAGSPLYEVSSAFPQLKQWYGLLVGLVYTIPYSCFGLVAGKLSDNVNRKLFLAICVALASVTMGISGVTTSFFVFSAMRVIHGCLNSASNPLSFSLIADYFPPDKRGTANSIIQAGNYIGVGVSSLSIMLISKFGWRASYMAMGAAGIVCSLLTLLGIKEPERGRYMDEAAKQKEAEKKAKAAELASQGGNPIAAFFKNIGEVVKLPCARNVLIASSLRNFGGMIVSSFLPVFFGKNFPAFKAEYALLNAMALSICGFVASLSGGIISDKFEKKSYWTKALICMFGCAMSVPLIALGTLSTANFYLSVACYALKVLVSGTYSGPAITMIQNTSPLSQQGNVISVYFFCITFAQTISPAIMTVFANKLGCLTNPAMYGPLITAAVAFGYLGSLPFWFAGGKAYKKHMEEKDAQEAAGLLEGA